MWSWVRKGRPDSTSLMLPDMPRCINHVSLPKSNMMYLLRRPMFISVWPFSEANRSTSTGHRRLGLRTSTFVTFLLASPLSSPLFVVSTSAVRACSSLFSSGAERCLGFSKSLRGPFTLWASLNYNFVVKRNEASWLNEHV